MTAPNGGRAKLHAVPPPERPQDRPAIRLGGNDLHGQVGSCIAALAGHANIYQRARALVSIDRGAVAPEGQRGDPPIIRSLTRHHLAPILTSRAYFEKFNREGALVPAMPPETLVNAVLAGAPGTPHTWPGVRRLEGLLECPTFLPDGRILEAEGYDPESGYVLVPSDRFVPVPEAPTRDDARAALGELLEPLLDFPHAREDQRGEALCGPARSATIAALLTILARPAIGGSVPCFLFESSTAGSGKGLQCHVISIIATGRDAASVPWKEDQTEREKELVSYVRAGAQIIVCDNISTPFGGGVLDSCVTAPDDVSLRPLGSSVIEVLPWRSTILASGNNVTLIGDVARRTLISRLQPGEAPERRDDFRIPGGSDGLRAWVRWNRPRLLRAALTILRAWHLAGRPQPGGTVGNFEAWSSVVAAALIWAGGADPRSCLATAAEGADPVRAALMTVLEHWPRLEAILEGKAPSEAASGKGIKVKAALDYLFKRKPRGEEGEEAGPAEDGFEDLREALDTVAGTRPGFPPDARALGLWLRDRRDSVHGGKTLARVGGDTKVRWTVRTVTA